MGQSGQEVGRQHARRPPGTPVVNLLVALFLFCLCLCLCLCLYPQYAGRPQGTPVGNPIEPRKIAIRAVLNRNWGIKDRGCYIARTSCCRDTRQAF